MSERTEALMRIVVGIISGIVLEVWSWIVQVITVIHWVFVLITGKRHKELAVFCETWNTHLYKFLRYMTFNTNTRIFPFERLVKNLEKYDRKVKG